MTIEEKDPNAAALVESTSTIVPQIETRLQRHSAANSGLLAIAVSSTTVSLTSAQFWGAKGFHLTDDTPGGAVTLDVPSGEERGDFVVVNDCGQTVTVEITGQSGTSPTIADGERKAFYSDGVNVYPLGGGGTFTSLEDSPASYSGQGGKAVAVNSGETALEFVDRVYDVPLSYAGTPGSSEIIGRLVIPRAVVFAANFSGSYGYVGTNPTASFAISVQDDGTEIGTITIATGGTFTFATTSGTAKTVAAGSRLDFVAPASTDATVANIAATLAGTI